MRFPPGSRIELDPQSRQFGTATLFGGSPARIVRLSPAGEAALAELRTGQVRGPASAALAARLVDAGLAHPAPRPDAARSAIVVVPVRDRPAQLSACLAAVGGRYPVLVVDDASAAPDAVARVCARFGARLLRRDLNGGPAAARNTALSELAALADDAPEVVAFLDSDCVAPADWIARLSGHLRDPTVAAVAPRVVAAAPLATGFAARLGAARSPLDMGERRARVAPMTTVSYLPTAALLVRRRALDGLRFDEALRFGEDVDLVWRLLDGGWQVQYEPAVQVTHTEPRRWPELLRRRYDYGTSAAALSRRHPGRLAPLVLQPGPAALALAVAARRPGLACAAFAAATALVARRLPEGEVPFRLAPQLAARGGWQTWLGAGRWLGQFAPAIPLLALARPGPGSRRARRGRRAVAASLLLAPAMAEWRQRRPGSGPAWFAIGTLADQAAYGAGVWRGCLRHRTIAPILPAISPGSVTRAGLARLDASTRSN